MAGVWTEPAEVRCGQRPSAVLRLHDRFHADDCALGLRITAERDGARLSVETDAWYGDQLLVLDTFLAGLASSPGWHGERALHSECLSVAAVHHVTGVVALTWTLREPVVAQGSAGDGFWLTTWIEAGEPLRKVAADIATFLHAPWL